MRTLQLLSWLGALLVNSISLAATPTQVSGTGEPPRVTTLPAHFSQYASVPIGQNRQCVVGARTDEDGMQQQPVAYVRKANSQRPIWVAKLNVPADLYQSRATHCTSHQGSLFVLLQSDTQSQQSLSQTLLRVVRIDAANGAVLLERDLPLEQAYSAWVSKGVKYFRWEGTRLSVTGQLNPAADRQARTPFKVRLGDDLKP